MDASQFASEFARNYNSGWHAEHKLAVRIHSLWCVLYCLSARGQGRRDVSCNMGTSSTEIQAPAIFLAIFHLPRAERIGFGLLELLQYVLWHARCLGRPVLCRSRYVAEDAQRRVADRILADISSGLGHSLDHASNLSSFFTQNPTKLPLKSSLMDYWNGCCAEHPLSYKVWSPPMLCEMLITKEFSPHAHARNSATMTRTELTDGA